MPALKGRPAFEPGAIMIVDDSSANLKLMEEMLAQKGHEVSSFPLGRLALAAATENPPDLILLDVNMPEMNGYDVCARFKSMERICDIPVIFLTALNETPDKVMAFRAGAADFISKPFQLEEFHARVETHLSLHKLQRTLKAQNERLETAVEARTRQLAEANERLTILDDSKNQFLKLISHEFRTPLFGLLGAGELILEGMAHTPQNDELQDVFNVSRHRILSLLDDALLLTEIDAAAERFKAAPVCLDRVLHYAVEKTAEFAESRRVALVSPASGNEFVLGHESLLGRALHALIETAVKFSAAGGQVRLTSSRERGLPLVFIESSGRAIPEQARSRFFELLSIGDTITPGGDLGLAPFMAFRILSLFGASVEVENLDPPGIRLTVVLRNQQVGAAALIPPQEIPVSLHYPDGGLAQLELPRAL
jgi:DNA-binding response OmpR family regulator